MQSGVLFDGRQHWYLFTDKDTADIQTGAGPVIYSADGWSQP